MRTDLTAFATEVVSGLGFTPASHHLLLLRELQAIASGSNDRLIVTMPPGSAKSTYASKIFAAWFLAQASNLRIIGASHTSDLAESVSRDVQRIIRDNSRTLGYHLTRESVEDWEVSNGGAYKAAGIGGPVTGRRADLAIIDDPVKSRADADSDAYRERAWNWFSADLRTRLKPGGRIVLIMTRWHEDDLGGRLLLQQRDAWRQINLPAQAVDNDPLGRERGEWLWSDDAYGYGAELQKAKIEFEANGAMRDWSALYQQDPRPTEGALFKIGMIKPIDAEPAGGQIVRAWDLAATKQTGTRDPDWTVGVKLQRTPIGSYVVLDVVRVRGGPDEVQATIVNTAKLDGPRVRISLPQDPGQAGKTQVLYLTRALVGFTVESSPETGDKATRASPAASQVNVGNFSVLANKAWTAPFLDELASFPSGTKDDQVDALSRAFSMVGLTQDYAARFRALS